MKLRNASENYVVPPVGRYKFKITASEATQAQSSGAPMIKITGEIREPQQYAGAQFFDNMITDESFKGSGFGKKKLRGLGVPVDSEQEIPDGQIAQHLLGLEGWVDVDHEQIHDKNPSTGEYDVPRWNMENGQRVPANKLVAKGYYTNAVPQTQAPQAQAPQFAAPQAPQGAPQFGAPQMGAPAGAPTFAGGFPAAPGGYPAQGAPQFAPQAPQGAPQQGWTPPGAAIAPQGAPQGYAGAPGAPQGYGAPQFGAPNGSQPAQGGLPWAQPPQGQAPQAEAGAGGGTGGGRGRKKAS